jgi:hypothetical protein
LKKILFILIASSLFSCLEKYDFNVLNTSKGLVVEASISDISFSESKSFPSDGRYFNVRLTTTSDVDNKRDSKINDAAVRLMSEDGEVFNYTHALKEDGMYYLINESFKAARNKKYQLKINLLGGQEFESAWEMMPTGENTIGEINYNETRIEKYVFEAGEKVIRPITGINVNLKLPENEFARNQYIKWSFDPLWTYSAALLPVESPIKNCWVRSNLYLKQYELAKFRKGGFDQELFFIETKGNWRLYDYFSALIHQEKMTPEFYQFWKDLQAQGDQGGLYDQPPFGLITNFKSLNSDWTVNGYFGVIDENTVRWEFDPSQLTYLIENDLNQFCLENAVRDPRLPPDQCFDCRSHTLGESVNVKPLWWSRL